MRCKLLNSEGFTVNGLHETNLQTTHGGFAKNNLQQTLFLTKSKASQSAQRRRRAAMRWLNLSALLLAAGLLLAAAGVQGTLTRTAPRELARHTATEPTCSACWAWERPLARLLSRPPWPRRRSGLRATGGRTR